MSRMKFFLQVTEDVQSLADSLRELVEAMQSGEPDQVVVPKPKAKEDPVEPEAKQPTLEEVRGLLARKSQEGKSSDVKALIGKFGAIRLSDIQVESYLALMTEAEVL